MRARFQPVLEKLASLLWYLGRPSLYCLWLCKERWPRRMDGLWVMVHQPEWQKSTFQSVAVWLMATPVIFDVYHRTGHGVAASISVGLVFDCAVFGVNKLWVWRHRCTNLPKSGIRNVAVWGVTFCINLAMAWLVIRRIGVEPGRLLLGCYGVGMNPVMFKVRDKIVFAECSFREATAALLRKDRAKAEVLPRFLRY